MKNKFEIEEVLKDKIARLAFYNNPPIQAKPCKLCGNVPPVIIGGDEPWADIGFSKRNTLSTEIRILKWVLDDEKD